MAQHYMLSERHPLDVFFSPRNIAVIGATERAHSVGRACMENLLSGGFEGKIYPVNPTRPAILGVPAFASVADLPPAVDLAVIITPPATIPGLIRECGAKGIRGAVVISAGFKEVGPEGAELERQLLAEARAAGVRVVGPNCLGLMSPSTGVNATFAQAMARPGNIAFISQSGAMCTAVLDWSFQELVGFSAFVSTGSMLDIGWGDLIDYLGQDDRTRAILIYMESIGDARQFLSAAREVALTKPIIVIKAGRTAQGGQAAASHTGSLTGSDDVLDAAFRRSGVLRVESIAELFYMAEVLAKQPRPSGPHLTILTNAGGPAVLATDALISAGGLLTELTPDTITALNQVCPPTWSHHNPIDIIGDADPERYAKSLAIAAQDPNSDGLLVILTPQAMTSPTEIAEQLKPLAKLSHQGRAKPVLASWMGGPIVEAGEKILNEAGIPTFRYPDTAARMFEYMWRYTDNLRGLYETPAYTELDADTQIARSIIDTARAAGRRILTEHESKQILAAYGIPVTPTAIATTAEDAMVAAEAMGYPVVLKLHSLTITHKTDVGGVQLNLRDAGAVREAFARIEAGVPAADFQGVNVQPMEKLDGYELILGSSVDPQFGPVLLFGAGGVMVEVFEDRALALPPLNTTLARRMMEETKILKALKGIRGRAPVDLEALAQLMVRFSQLVLEQRWISEIDINPLLASPTRLLALDARIVLHEQAPQVRSAIRPYPQQYVGDWLARDASEVRFRPIRPEDEPAMVVFHESLSDRSIYLRYFQFMKLSQRVAHERLTRICFNDYDREIALVAEQDGAILGVGRLKRVPGYEQEVELGLLINDRAQGKGLGTEMMRRLVEVARQEGAVAITADVHSENSRMLKIIRSFGFHVTQPDPGDPVFSGRLDLGSGR
ncbi:MAG: bifunctional acetate--CoA ligase family protein/GNAT family N-acetyltransferase [Acidobacteria bacterium]|nr:bifunctional acetate--CoA ligase family protein/GNAT family N-acetyltransferase [Acidobacteriota bacterium]